MFFIPSPSHYSGVIIRNNATTLGWHMSLCYYSYLHLIDRKEKGHEISLKCDIAEHKSVSLKTHMRVIDNGITLFDM